LGRPLFYIFNNFEMKFCKKSLKIRGNCAVETFLKVREDRSFLFESKDISHIYGRLSLIGVDPVLEIRGKDNKYSIEVLNERGEQYLEGMELEGTIEKEEGSFEEGERTKRKNISQVIRKFLNKNKIEEREFIGLYGAFSYDFIRLFEDLPNLLPENGVEDFRLQLFDTFVFFDHLKEVKEVIAYRDGEHLAEVACKDIVRKIEKTELKHGEYKISDAKFDMEKDEYMKMVDGARELAREGELFEIVYSNTLNGGFDGDPFALYEKYADVNPSPYLFFFDFGNEQLVGASPEMMVRCEHGDVHLRPISGTAKRGDDPVEDHENMMKLLNSDKERSELDMLIDLGRNDLSRICEPGVEISDYRFVEKYSKVMHTVAHVSGKLREGYTAFDSLIACLNAGTLTGAPKVAAMEHIEKNEKTRRGYYGGTIGYLTLSGEMDTGIIIRTAHIKNGALSFRVGATLLYDSDPASEYQETLDKAKAFLTLFS